MILAYLRNPDFIKPDYEHGIKSRLREELFIKTAALEFSKEMQIVNLGVLSGYFVGCSDSQSRKEILSSIHECVDRIEGTFSFEFGASRSKRIETSRERTVQILELLSKKGIVGVSDGFTPEKVREIISEYKKQKEVKK